MSINTKQITIGNHQITITQFGAIESLNLRKELSEHVKNQLGIISSQPVDMIKGLAALVYEISPNLLLKLFKNCSAIDIGGLGNIVNFEKVFSSNLDGTIELALEVLELNGFFTLNIISILSKKFPMLTPMESAIRESIMKVNQTMQENQTLK